MAMKRCPVCGEMYSDTYKYCPFCEEEEIMQERREGKGGGRRAGHSFRFNLVTPILIVLILVMVWLLIYLIWGNPIAKKKPDSGLPQQQTETAQKPASSETQKPAASPEGTAAPAEPEPAKMPEETTKPGTMPEGTTPVTVPASEYDKISALPTGLGLNKKDYTTKVGDAPVQLKATGGTGNYTWVSEDPSIASVDEKGKVAAMSAGTVNILVSDGTNKGVCIVRVKAGSGTPNTTGTTPPAGTGGNETQTGSETTSGLAIANSGGKTLPMSGGQYDCTISAGSSAALHVTGTKESVTWASKNSDIATVSEKGNVTGVAAGTTTVTATVGGETLSVIIRVR